MTDLAEQYAHWIGREEVSSSQLSPALASRWLGTFDLPMPADGAMPQGIHWCLNTPNTPTSALGEDGHPARRDADAGILPPVPLPRRMWASSALHFHRPIGIGDQVERYSRTTGLTEKQGGHGRLFLVTVEHLTTVRGERAIEEKQTLAYLEARDREGPLSPEEPGEGAFAPSGWDAQREVVPQPPLLFRYSALTFNSHRIHYDLAYARDVERYRGLVVHGPLIASLLLQLAAQRFGDNRLARFSFRGVSPAIAGEPLHLAMRGAGDVLQMGAFAADGRQVTRAEAMLA